jgi:hypothetical protein
MAVDRHDWGATVTYCSAGAAWRMAAVGAVGGLYSSEEDHCRRQTAAGGGRRGLMGGGGGQALIGRSIVVLWLAVLIE